MPGIEMLRKSSSKQELHRRQSLLQQALESALFDESKVHEYIEKAFRRPRVSSPLDMDMQASRGPSPSASLVGTKTFETMRNSSPPFKPV